LLKEEREKKIRGYRAVRVAFLIIFTLCIKFILSSWYGSSLKMSLWNKYSKNYIFVVNVNPLEDSRQHCRTKKKKKMKKKKKNEKHKKDFF
jgi:hypothetical protein